MKYLQINFGREPTELPIIVAVADDQLEPLKQSLLEVRERSLQQDWYSNWDDCAYKEDCWIREAIKKHCGTRIYADTIVTV